MVADEVMDYYDDNLFFLELVFLLLFVFEKKKKVHTEKSIVINNRFRIA